MIKKFGENRTFTQNNILEPRVALSNKDIEARFIKMAKKLKKVAPRAKDFLYGSCVMMHAAEAALIDQNTGKPVLNKSGKPVVGHFENFVNQEGQESVRWVSADNVKPYKNANGDIFGEEELLKAYKNWIGKPLCKDHKSDSVDGIRGIIIDTYYDPKFKRVHALFALDRKNYADLARKVETGCATSVSMGTGVGRSICTDCGKVAMTERDYCKCVKARTNFGEINLDLSPIELSLVVNGADGLAKIRQIVASMNNYVQKKQTRIAELKATRCVNPTELQALSDAISDIQTKLNSITQFEKVAEVTESNQDVIRAIVEALKAATDPDVKRELEDQLKELVIESGEPESDEGDEFEPQPARSTMGGGSEHTTPEWADAEISLDPAKPMAANPPELSSLSNRLVSRKLRTKEGGTQGALLREISLLRSKITQMDKSLSELKSIYSEDKNMNSARLKARARARRAYWLGGGGVNDPAKLPYEKEDADSIRDKEDKQMVGEPLETGSEGLHPGDEEVKKKWLRAQELENRRMKRRAYWQGGGGVNEPTPGKEKYPKEDSDSIRNKEDKQMVGEPLDTGRDGLHPGDAEVKKKWLRARLSAQFVKVADEDGNINKSASHWNIRAGDKLVLTASGDEIFGDELDDKWDFLSSKAYGREVLRHIREEGFDRTAYLLKGAQDPMAAAAPAAPMPDAGLGLDAPAAPMPDAPAAPGGDVEVKEEKNETQQKVDAALNAMEEKIAEMRELISGMSSDELVDIDVNIDEKNKGKEPAPEAASPLEGALASKKDILKVEALMNLSADELAEASETLETLENVPSNVMLAVSAALEDSSTILASAEKFLKLAKSKKEDKEDKDKKDKDEKEDKKDKKEDKDKKDKDEKKEAQKLLDDALKLRAANRAALLAKAMGEDAMYGMDGMCAECGDLAHDGMCGDDMMLDDAEKKDLGLKLLDLDMPADDKEDKDKKDKKDKKEKDDEDEKDEDKEDEGEEDDAMMVLEDTQSVLAARRAERDQLLVQAKSNLGEGYELDLGPAQNATEPKYFDAHPGGKGTVTDLTYSKTPEAKVETISEVHDIMRDVAESGPRNVRDAAQKIQEYIVKGAIKASDLDQLVAEGKADAAAVSYWKKYWAQAPDDGGFGADMSKEFASKKKEASEKNWRAKLRRAYDIGLEAQDKGLIGLTRQALDKYVDELMTFDDASFESTKRVISSYSSSKKSGSFPNVTSDGHSQPIGVNASIEPVESISNQLASLGWK